MRYLTASNGEKFIVDGLDYLCLCDSNWHANSKGYAYRYVNGIKEKLHHAILRFRGVQRNGHQVDHKDNNPKNNLRSNLRLATNQQNSRNRRLLGGSSKYKGVLWWKQKGKWRAQIKVDGKLIYLGLYDNEEEAALAYDCAARLIDQDYFLTNLPDSEPVPKLIHQFVVGQVQKHICLLAPA